jgi:hypothetical protein
MVCCQNVSPEYIPNIKLILRDRSYLVAIPALFLNLTMVTDLCSIGTLFAFVLVCAGVFLAE